jgi:hypothetical protein
LPAHPERQISKRLATMLRTTARIPGLAWCCTSMERATEGGRKLAHALGYQAGWPDWVFFAGATTVQPYARVLFVELKAGNNQLDDNQRTMHAALIATGLPVVVRRSAASAHATAQRFALGAQEFENDC